MTVIFSIVFILSLVSGFAYGWINKLSGLPFAFSISVGGFLGSCVIAVLFTYMYFTHEETNKEKIKRLKNEIAQLKQEK